MNVDHLKRRYLQIVAAALVGFGLTGVVAGEIALGERESEVAVFNMGARNRAINLQEHFRGRENLVGMVEALFEASREVTPAEFERFLGAMRLRRQGVSAVYWLPSGASGPRVAYAHTEGCAPGIEPHLIALAQEVISARPSDGVVLGRPAQPGLCTARGGTFLLAGMVDALMGTASADAAAESAGVVIMALDVSEVVDEFYGARPELREHVTLMTSEYKTGREVELYDRGPSRATGETSRREKLLGWRETLTLGGQPIRIFINPTRGSLSLANNDRSWQVALFGFLSIGGLAAYAARRVRDSSKLAGINTKLREVNDRLEHANLRLQGEMEERQKREGEMLQGRKMEALGRLAGGIAHDFNNLLTAIRGYAELLALRLDDPSERDDTDQIITAADSAARLTRELLTFSRRDVVEPRAIDLASALFELSKMLVRLLGSEIELVTDLAPSLPPVFIDPSHLQQVVINLAVNARDAMPRGGRVTLKTRSAGADQVELEVADTGHGMAPEVIEHIFEPFFTTKRADRGTGLGLATVYGIVSSLPGGSIRVESLPGAGSRFYVLLPVAEGEVLRDAIAAATGPTAGGEQILLVEDRDDVRKLTCRILEEQGYQVLAAADPATALLAGADPAQRIDLLIADLGLPQMSGVEVARRLRQRRPRLRTMFISGYQGEILEERLGTEKMDVLPKPFTASELLQRVRVRLDMPEES